MTAVAVPAGRNASRCVLSVIESNAVTRSTGCKLERMGTVTKISRAKFGVERLIHHRLFDYRA
jgi:hypothetical protein